MRDSLYDELSAKLDADPRLARRSGPRVDLGLLLFGARDEIRALWVAAEGAVTSDRSGSSDLAEAVEALRPLFGERG